MNVVIVLPDIVCMNVPCQEGIFHVPTFISFLVVVYSLALPHIHFGNKCMRNLQFS